MSKNTQNPNSKKLKLRIFTPLSILLLISILFFYSFCKQSEKRDVLTQLVVQLINMSHFNPEPLDDNFSNKVYTLYIKALDSGKQFFTQEDIDLLEQYSKKIDDEIRSNSFKFYDLSLQLFDKRAKEVQDYYKEILSTPFDFTINENVEIDPEKINYPTNSHDLKERWRKLLKFRTMSRLSDAISVQEKGSGSKKSMEQLESEARDKVLTTHNDWFRSITDKNEETRFGIYLGAISNAFDPHTQYQTPVEKETFDISMTGKFEGIGALLQESDDYIKVAGILPGSPAWMGGELKVNDMIMKVKQEKQEPVDILGMRINDVVKLIRGKKGTKVTLTVKRIDGSINDITITRDVVINEETYAKSAILNDPVTKTKVGYIYLPKFYVDFNNMATGRACSDDVAKEIEKLKNDNIQGIILDLRNNTGGSLPDAIKMSGLFIPSGPIVQVQRNIGTPGIYKDPDPQTKYDGPLIVLVNTLSASASEILAAAMQDYQRAVIIGGPSTFGKGTVQEVEDLDKYLPVNMRSMRPLGSLLLTIQKFYRINGGATQLKGVIPDIILPDLYSELGVGEKYTDFCMPWTSINPAGYTIWKNPVSIEKLKVKSIERTSKNKDFTFLSEQVAALKKQKNDTDMPLNLETYQKNESSRKAESKRFDEMNKQSTILKVEALSADKMEMKNDTSKMARSEKWLSELNKDLYLEEAVKVIGDMK